MDRSLALQALSALCNADITSKGCGDHHHHAATLCISNFISTVLDCEECSEVSHCHFTCLQSILQGEGQAAQYTPLDELRQAAERDSSKRKNFVIDEEEFFDPRYDYDYTNLKDTEVYYRGAEVYERPCGWYRFALKVLNEYPGGNTWLGTSRRSTSSVPGEWPVSYHGTSKAGAGGIIEGNYEAGSGQAYGRGIYSTPHMSEAIHYCKAFVAKDGKKYYAVLQNRINIRYRKKFYYDKYWLIPIPKGTSDDKEEDLVERSIRPYGLLIKRA